MRKFELGAMVDLLLHRLKCGERLTKQKIYAFTSTGFRALQKHFEEAGISFVDDDMLKSYIERQHSIYGGDKKQKWRWQIIRQSTEMLMYFVKTGRIDLPKLPRWNKRDCLLYIEPTAEQLANNDSIHGLVWRTRHALRGFGYEERTLKYYDHGGFEKLLDAHRDAGLDVYSRQICAEMVLEAKRLVDEGKLYRYQAIRKAVALLDEFHQYGSITPGPLSAFEMKLLNPVFEALVEEYANDALFSGKLSETTATTGKSIIKGFLLDLEDEGHSSFDGVTLQIVSAVITKTAGTRYKRGSDSLLHYVRDFLKYLYEYGLIGTNLSVAVPKIAAPHKKAYQGFTDEEIRRLLAAVDRGTLKGKRDYAIMTLAAQTGLRSADIFELKRRDIDWRKREINIVQSKTGIAMSVPLETESGNALCDYILNARQKCDIPNVFLGSEYPLRALQRQAARSIIQKYMAIAGIESGIHQRYGFHSFRRAFGTRLLESGAPVHLLSQLLGHTGLNSAKPYMSASEQGLKECGLPLCLGEGGGAV